jgi:hypothetical protein
MSATKASRPKAAAVGAPEGREVIPLAQRPWDILYLVFFLVNIFIITYIVDIEQLTSMLYVVHDESLSHRLTIQTNVQSPSHGQL